MKLKTISTIIISIIACAIISCNKNNDVPKSDVTTSINIINAGTDTLKFYAAGSVKNTNSYIYPGGISGYLTVPSGAQDYNFKRSANGTNYNSEYLFPASLKLNIVDSTYNSLFVAGETADKCILAKDTLGSLSNKALVRFVHASSSVSAVDVFLGDSVNFKNKNFKAVTSYMPVSAGTKKLIVNQAGSNSNLIGNGTITLTSGSNYTIYLKGKVNGTGTSALGYGVVPH